MPSQRHHHNSMHASKSEARAATNSPRPMPPASRRIPVLLQAAKNARGAGIGRHFLLVGLGAGRTASPWRGGAPLLLWRLRPPQAPHSSRCSSSKGALLRSLHHGLPALLQVLLRRRRLFRRRPRPHRNVHRPCLRRGLWPPGLQGPTRCNRLPHCHLAKQSSWHSQGKASRHAEGETGALLPAARCCKKLSSWVRARKCRVWMGNSSSSH